MVGVRCHAACVGAHLGQVAELAELRSACAHSPRDGGVLRGAWGCAAASAHTLRSVLLAAFAGAVGIFMLGFHGLAYSFFPFIVPDRLTVWQAAAAPESLMIIFVGALVVLPIIAVYSAFAYRTFWGKATDLRYY